MILVPLLCAVVGIFLIRSTRFPAQESAGTNRLSGVLAASALLWVFGAVLAMFFVPVIVQEWYMPTVPSPSASILRASSKIPSQVVGKASGLPPASIRAASSQDRCTSSRAITY